MSPEQQKAARDELEMDLSMLRRLGVKTFKGSGLDVEFFQTEAPEEKRPAKVADPDLCACGHQKFAHTNGLCVEGCTDEQCNPKDGAKK